MESFELGNAFIVKMQDGGKPLLCLIPSHQDAFVIALGNIAGLDGDARWICGDEVHLVTQMKVAHLVSLWDRLTHEVDPFLCIVRKDDTRYDYISRIETGLDISLEEILSHLHPGNNIKLRKIHSVK